MNGGSQIVSWTASSGGGLERGQDNAQRRLHPARRTPPCGRRHRPAEIRGDHQARRDRSRPDSPAARGGLKQGDIVIGVAGKAVQRQRDLAAAVADAKPGSTVAVTVLRSGRRMDHRVAVGEPPGPTGPAAATPQDAAGAVDAAREAGRPAAATRIEGGGRASEAPPPSEAG